MNTNKPTVFISYNWGSDKIANELESNLSEFACVKRDKSSVDAWESLVQFMNSIREQDFAVLIISDKYLKSVNCMYEVMQLMKDNTWEQKVMFIVEDSACGIYNTEKQLDYIGYWENRGKELSESIKKHDPAAIAEQSNELKKVNMIKLQIGEFMGKVKDVSNPDINLAVDAVVNRVNKLSHRLDVVNSSGNSSNDVFTNNISILSPEMSIELLKNDPQMLQISLGAIANSLNKPLDVLPNGYKPHVDIRNGKAIITSVPENDIAAKKYPQRIKGEFLFTDINKNDKSVQDILKRSALEQTSIPIKVVSMQKFIGDMIDPFQQAFQEQMKQSRFEIVPPKPLEYIVDIGIESDGVFYKGIIMKQVPVKVEDNIVRFESDPELPDENGNKGLGFRITYHTDTQALDFNYKYIRCSWDGMKQYMLFMKAATADKTLYAALRDRDYNMFEATLTTPLYNSDEGNIDFTLAFIKDIRLIEAQFYVEFDWNIDYSDDDISLISFVADSVRGKPQEVRWSEFTVNGVLHPEKALLKAIGDDSDQDKNDKIKTLIDNLSMDFKFGFHEETDIIIGNVTLQNVVIQYEFETAHISNIREIIDSYGYDEFITDLDSGKNMGQVELLIAPGSSDKATRIIVC